VFPVLGESGEVLEIYGRRIRNRTSEGYSSHLYLKGPHRGVWNLKAFKLYDEIIMCEGIIDTLSLYMLGLENVSSLYGVNGFTSDHLKVLQEHHIKRVILAFDSDEQGKKASVKLKERLISEGFEVKRCFPPVTKDWNDYLLSNLSLEEKKREVKEVISCKLQGISSLKPIVSNLEVKREGPIYEFKGDTITYRLSGVRDLFLSDLRVNVKVICKGESHYDQVNLFSARSRTSYSQSLSRLFSVEGKKIEKDLIYILETLERERDRKLLGEEEESPLSDEERDLALSFLESDDQMVEIDDDMTVLGYVCEKWNKCLAYVSATSRLLTDPISLVIQSQSSSGKSKLMEIIKDLMPSRDVVSVTSLSDQALNYLPKGGLLHKLLILGESVHSESVDHQIREMLSSKELSRLVTVKDEKTGELMTKCVKQKALVSVMMTTTRSLNHENASRCFVIHTDESKDQTKRIHASQREKYSIKRYHEKRHLIPKIIKKHRAAQEMLKPIFIVNPFASLLDFPNSLMRLRRDHERFIDLIASIAFLRQYQKEKKSFYDRVTNSHIEYIDCDLRDYELSYEIMTKAVFPATLSEFPKTLTEFYEEILKITKEKARVEGLKPEEISFSQREIREKIDWLSKESIKRYLRTLVTYEYLYTKGTRGQIYHYRLVRDESIKDLKLSQIPSPKEMKEKWITMKNSVKDDIETNKPKVGKLGKSGEIPQFLPSKPL
jgi:5S rRNA maturation endonuclease (ribonuclease M5)